MNEELQITNGRKDLGIYNKYQYLIKSPFEVGDRRAGDDNRLDIELSVEINFFKESPFVPLESRGK